MIRVAQGGAAIAVELWEVPAAGLAAILLGWRAYVEARGRS